MSNRNLYERNKNQELEDKEYEDVILNKENYKDSKFANDPKQITEKLNCNKDN